MSGYVWMGPKFVIEFTSLLYLSWADVFGFHNNQCGTVLINTQKKNKRN